MVAGLALLAVSSADGTARPTSRLDLPPTAVVATIRIAVNPPAGAVLLYTAPDYDQPVRFPRPREHEGDATSIAYGSHRVGGSSNSGSKFLAALMLSTELGLESAIEIAGRRMPTAMRHRRAWREEGRPGSSLSRA